MPVYSHLVPVLIPLARALTRAGHDVRVATGDDLAGEVDKAGLGFLNLPRAVTAARVAEDPELAASMGIGPGGVPDADTSSDPGAAFGRLFGGRYAVRFAEDLLAAADGWVPDLVVREPTALGGHLVAEKLGAAEAVLDIAPFAPSRHPGTVPYLEESRSALGIGPAARTDVVAGAFWAGLLPPDWYPAETRPPNLHCYRLAERDDTTLDEDQRPEPADDRPLVLASLGSNSGLGLADETTVLTRVIEALGSLRCTAVVALGSHHDPATWSGPRPANVTLLPFVQQRLLLRCCAAFVTHAGFNSVRESLAEGVPMVAIPLYAEQPANAARIAELGLGVTPPSDADRTTLAGAISQVLENRRYGDRARNVQRALLTLPGMDGLVADLTAWGSTGRSQRNRPGVSSRRGCEG